jgi:hypothetical protein
MNDQMNGDDERLRALFHDAVSDVEPRDGLGEVRRRTRMRRTASRRWAPVLAGAGAVAATVAVATVVVNGVNDDPQRDDEPPVAGTSQGPATAAAALYYVSDTDTGPRLFREFQAIGIAADDEQKVLLALQRLTADSGPRDPDYHTLWPADSFRAVRLEADERIVVELGTTDALEGDPADGRLGVQQAVYTAEAALGETLPVSFELDGEPARKVLGLEVGTVVARDRGFDITAPVNITNPAEQLAVEDGVLLADGTVATYIDGDVTWSLEDSGGAVVLDGSAEPAEVTGPDATATLGVPGWESEVDVSGLPPGDYVFVVTVTAVGQTSDQPAEFSDTRTITVR